MNPIPHFDHGGEGPPLHFLHANGYPPECYAPLLNRLGQQHRVFGMLLRPLWKNAAPDQLEDWHPLSDDLLRFLSTHPAEPVIGVGHSIGGIVTLRAAIREPKKFKALILLDPVLFIPPILTGWRIVRALGWGERLHPLIARAKKRRRTFNNLDTVFRGYRSRPVFRHLSDEHLRLLIEGITGKNSDGGYQLVYTPEWEARIYLTGLRDFDLWRAIPGLTVPTLILRGSETDTFRENAGALITRKNPNIQVITLQNATHILPLEHPREVAEHIENFLRTSVSPA